MREDIVSGAQTISSHASNLHLKAYEEYIRKLQELVNADQKPIEITKKALDGGAYEALRTLIPISNRRQIGAFFSSSELSLVIAKEAAKRLKPQHKIIDPACGAGDLLLAIARLLPIKDTVQNTIHYWGKKLYGFDLYSEFITTTKLRLTLLAIERCQENIDIENIHSFFPNIRQADAMNNLDIISKTHCILLNPPYISVEAPESCEWASGSVSSAALFLDEVFSALAPRNRIYAILPEVLKCGSRYSKLRGKISQHTRLLFCKSIGLFDKWTDVDVFIAGIQKNKTSKKPNLELFNSCKKANKTVGDYFTIRVGSVVLHRAPEKGKSYPYIDTKELVPWAENFESDAQRKYNGTVFKAPFVAIRRNSRPNDGNRAVGTIVLSNSKPVAVENHLIVALPKNGTYEECKKLLEVLKNASTHEYLNTVMRCRHLTVKSVKEIPWITEINV